MRMTKRRCNVPMDPELAKVVDDLRARGIRAEDIMSMGVSSIVGGNLPGAVPKAPAVSGANPAPNTLEDSLKTIAVISAEARKDAAASLANGMQMGMQMMQMGLNVAGEFGGEGGEPESQEDRAAALLLAAAEGKLAGTSGQGQQGQASGVNNRWGVPLQDGASPLPSSNQVSTGGTPRPPPVEQQDIQR